MTTPRYQDVTSEAIPEAVDDDGTHARVICGSFWGKKGPVDGVAADPRYLDVFVPAGRRKTLPVELGRNAFAYVFDGSGTFRDASAPRRVKTEDVGEPETAASDAATPGALAAPAPHELSAPDVSNRSLILFDRGDEVTVQAGDAGIRFLLVSGKPIEEPVAWYGPIVMNTKEELRKAYDELQTGTFIKHR